MHVWECMHWTLQVVSHRHVITTHHNEYFCEVEEDYILDHINFTGLNTEVQNYSQALELIPNNLSMPRQPVNTPHLHLSYIGAFR